MFDRISSKGRFTEPEAKGVMHRILVRSLLLCECMLPQAYG